MFLVKTKAKNIKDIFDLYHKTDYFGFDDDYIIRPCNSSIPFKFEEKDNLVFVDYGEQIPYSFERASWNENIEVSIVFEDEETALYYQLKWSE